MAAAGYQAEQALHDSMEKNAGKYILVVEGGIPTAENGIHCKIGGKTAMEMLEEVAANAAAIIAYGTCATFGGVQAAKPNPTGSVGVDSLVFDKPIINISGCPPNPVNFLGTVLHYLTFQRLPAVDSLKRPKFAYGRRIHDHCERLAHFDEGRFVDLIEVDAASRTKVDQTRDLLEAMIADYPQAADVVLRVDGGMTASDWTMQFLADILGAQVDRPKVLETTALGAAWLAGWRAGICGGPEDFAKGWALERRFGILKIDPPTRDQTIRLKVLQILDDAEVPFEQALSEAMSDGDLPDMEQGINHAKQGNAQTKKHTEDDPQ